MKFHPIVLAVGLLAATSTLCQSDTVFRTRPGLDDTRLLTDRTWLTAAETPSALVRPGDPAPDFAYQTESGEWFRLHHLLGHGSVLLVFMPNEGELRLMENERDSLYGVGVIPVAVLDRRTSSTGALAQRLGLGFPVIADPRGSIASQFNLIGPPTVRARPAWFVVDRSGRVRGLDRRGLPDRGYTRLACDALAIPSPDATVSTGAH